MVGKERLEAVAGTVREYISMGSDDQYAKATGVSPGDFSPVPEEDHTGRTFAIDGSNMVVLDWSVARANHIRAGYVVYRGRQWQKTVTTFDDIFLADARNYREQFLRYLRAAFGLDRFVLDETELERRSSYFRELQEYLALSRALKEAEEGDLVLYDGGFALWKDRPFGQVLETIFDKAAEKGVDLIAVSKSSTFSWGQGLSRPFVQHTGCLGRQCVPGRPWYLDLKDKTLEPSPSPEKWGGRIYVAMFHPQAERAFRVDVPRYLVDRAGSVLAHAACHSGSAESLGYPHALFRAHHELKINQDEGHLLRLRLLDALGRRGLGEEEVRGSLDYHEILDMSPRR
ncbi:MAG: DNA double-strand break repair nuclease NurA [Methanosarcinales archaeon]|nr:DNA double-strand break repair nuclease NurA [Methanosarcinales archaeon]